MKFDPTHHLELNGFEPCGTVTHIGPLASCEVRACRLGGEGSNQRLTAEWLESSQGQEEIYARLLRRWRLNARSQPMGSLGQVLLDEADDHLLRVIHRPLGEPMVEWLFKRRFTLEETLATSISLTRC